MVWQALEENYGGIESIRTSVMNQIESFEKIKKFDKNNMLRLLNLMLVIEEKFSDTNGLIDQGGVLNVQIKRLFPPDELTNYFLELAREDRRDSFQALKKFITMRRVAYKHSDINSTMPSRTLHASEDVAPSAPVEHEASEDKYETLAGYTPKTDYKPRYTPRADGDSKPKYTPKSEGDSKPPSKYFGKSGDQTEISKNCIMCKKDTCFGNVQSLS